jgi:hypothetical protein
MELMIPTIRLGRARSALGLGTTGLLDKALQSASTYRTPPVVVRDREQETFA